MGNLFSKTTSEEIESGRKRALEFDGVEDSKKVRIDRVIIKESEVGIVAYVNQDIKGFHSILKFRAEDFLVNEVDMDKNIVRLTSLAPPDTKVDKPSIFDQAVSEIFDKGFAELFRCFLDTPEEADAVLTTQASKEQRLEFYRLVEEHLEAKVNCRGKDGNLVVRWPSSTHSDEFIDWKALGGDYLQVNMQKSGVDTMNAINIISKKIGVQAKNFGYAGTKDAKAITTQSLTLKSVKPGRIVMAQEDLKKSNIYIGDFKFVPNGLTLGDLNGNHFTIVLRDVKGANEEELEVSLQSLKQNGFLNYFGMQRFGTSVVSTHTIGCAIMKKKFEEASDLILNPREGERPEYHNARKLWQDTHDAESVLAIFPKRAFSERKLLTFYARHPGNHSKAIKSLPKNMLSLYSHAYQSYIWNRVVSERARLFGTDKPMVGDLVLVDNTSQAAKSKLVNNNVGRRDPNNRKVPKILTAEDLDDYSIFDVVYPLPGRRTVYPENEIKEIYRKFLAEDDISIEKKDNHFDSLTGDYRAMLSKPEQMSWSFIRYDDPTEKLCNTDVDKLENAPEPMGIEGNCFPKANLF
ncbi:pseudouridine synthase [Choanephora cucurbitarum]|nr:pseudouridine synthase [Choanephora cucurbitarum]